MCFDYFFRFLLQGVSTTLSEYFVTVAGQTALITTDVHVQLGNLSVHGRNANCEGGSMVTAGAGALQRLRSLSATAEIEGDESDVVNVSPFRNGSFNIFCTESAPLEIAITILH